MLLEYAQHPFVRVVAALARRIAAEEAETAILMVCIRSGSFSNSPLRRECKCEPAHTRIEKSSVPLSPRPQQTADIASKREGNHTRQHWILICAALTTGLLLQGSSCFGDDRTKLTTRHRRAPAYTCQKSPTP